MRAGSRSRKRASDTGLPFPSVRLGFNPADCLETLKRALRCLRAAICPPGTCLQLPGFEVASRPEVAPAIPSVVKSDDQKMDSSLRVADWRAAVSPECRCGYAPPSPATPRLSATSTTRGSKTGLLPSRLGCARRRSARVARGAGPAPPGRSLRARTVAYAGGRASIPSIHERPTITSRIFRSTSSGVPEPGNRSRTPRPSRGAGNAARVPQACIGDVPIESRGCRSLS